MLLVGQKIFKKSSFINENELENVVMNNYELLFGNYSIYLPQKVVRTNEGFASIPDAVVLNFKERVWYIVEVELANHGVWSHIVPQVTKQMVAIENPEVRRKLIELFMDEVRKSAKLKEKFVKLGIDEIEIRRTIEEIIEKPPILAIPIDHIPADLKDWASVIKNEVRLLEIEKYLDDETQEIIYRIPEYLPIPLAETEEGEGKTKISRDEFLARCEEPARVLFSELEEIAIKKNNIVRLEPRITSFSFKIKIGTKEMTLLTIYPDSVYIMKYNLTPEKGFKPEVIEAFVKKIKKINSLSDRYDTMKQPGFSTKVSDISIDDIKTFADAIKELLDSSI